MTELETSLASIKSMTKVPYLSKREYATIMMAQGLVNSNMDQNWIATHAVKQADLLLEELSKG